MSRRFLLSVVGALATSVSQALPAQSVVSQMAFFAGNSTDARGTRGSTLTAAPRVVFFPQSPMTVSLAAQGTRFGGDAWQAGGDAAASVRSPAVGGVRVTLNAMTSLARTSYDVTLAQSQATPAVEWRLASLTLFGGAQFASGNTRVSGPAAVPTPSTPVVLTSVTRSARGPVWGAEWAVSSGALPLLSSYRDERVRIDGEWVHDRTVAANTAWGRVALGVSASRRLSLSENASAWSSSASVRLAGSVYVQAGAGRYPSMRLTGASGGRYATLGLVLASGAPSKRTLPRPAGVGAPPSGMTRLSLLAPDARRVEIAGDWNGWRRVPTLRTANGVWYIDLSLAPGEYRYAFRVDDGAWRVPDDAVVSSDGFGGQSAYVTVVSGSTRVVHQQEER